MSIKKVSVVTPNGSTRSWRLCLRLYEQSLRSGNKLWSTWLSFAKTLENKVSSRLATRSETARPPLAQKPSRIARLMNDSRRCLSDIVAKPTTQARHTVSLRLPQTWRWSLTLLHTYHGIEELSSRTATEHTCYWHLIHAQWHTDGWRWWRRTWWSLLLEINVKKLQFIHMLTATDLHISKTAKIKKVILLYHCTSSMCSSIVK